MLTQKKPKKTSRYTKIGKLALVFFGFLKFPNWHWFFLVFICFFWFFLALVLARTRNWKLVFFWFLLVFFGLGFGQHSKLETGFWFFWFFFVFFGIFWFFWHLILWLECHPKKNKKNQKIPKKTKKTQKNQKKPVATPKLVNWLGFFLVFLVFFGVSTPPNLSGGRGPC